LLRREGTGHKNAPFRYWLPAREAEWMKDPTYRLMRQDEEARYRAWFNTGRFRVTVAVAARFQRAGGIRPVGNVPPQPLSPETARY